MKWLSLILFVTGFGLSACQKNKSVVVEREVPAEDYADLPSPWGMDGGIDGGGGNGLEGKPLESYQIRLEKVPEFETYLEAVLVSLKSSFPELGRDISYLLREKRWYFVPVALKKIPAFKIGTFFPTDQIALQSRSEIWVDTGLYQKMDEEARVNLLMHELLMGVRMLEFASPLEKCLIRAEGGEDDKEIKDGRTLCVQRYRVDSNLSGLFKASEEINLSQEDYATIRKLTTWILEAKGEVDGEDLKERMELLGFRLY